MSAASVTVLTPNGRRQVVKCTPNTTIFQILEETCTKHNLKPDEYDLKHHNKIMDLSATFRYSGLPNNASLEMTPILKLRPESNITLAVNLENGSRLVGNFSPNETLSEILKILCPENATKENNPVVIYTRREIFGDDLNTTTLRKLGLTSGRAMIRLLNRNPDDLKVQANVSTALPLKPIEEKPFVRKLKVENDGKVEKMTEFIEDSERIEKDSNKIQVEKESKSINSKPEKYPKASVDILKLAREKRKSESWKGQEYVKRTPKENIVKVSSEVNVLNVDRDCNVRECRTMEAGSSGKTEEKCTNVAQDSVEKEFAYLGERNAMLFSLESAHSIPCEELPDDFFELTIDDARKILRDVKKQSQGSEDAPMLTSALRKLEESKRQLRQLGRYKKSIIRVQFPDRSVLQGTFSPIDTIRDVLEFVRGYLDDKGMDFCVYSTPPKRILEENERLIELGFVPGAMIHFGVNNQKNGTDFLRKNLRDKFTSNSLASLAAAKLRSEGTTREGLFESSEDSRNSEDDSDVDMETEKRENWNDQPGTSANSNGPDTDLDREVPQSCTSWNGTVPRWFKRQ